MTGALLAGCGGAVDTELETIPLAARPAPRPVLAVTPSPGNFGLVAQGETRTIAFTVANIAKKATTVASVAVTAEFAIAADGCTAVAVPKGGTCTVTVAFAASSPGAKTGALTVTPVGGPAATVPLSGTLDDAPPALTIDPSTATFAPTPLRLANAPSLDFLVSNNLDQEVTMAATVLAGANAADFEIDDFCVGQTLFVAEFPQCAVRVRFVPKTTGPKSATITVRTTRDPADTATASFSGMAFEGQPRLNFSGEAEGAPIALAFGSAAVGAMKVDYGQSGGAIATGPLRVFVTNGGNGPTTPMAITFEQQPHDFAIFWGAFNTCASRILDPGQSCEMTVAFTPQALGARAGVMRFASAAIGATNAVSLVANLSGTGDGVLGPAAITASPSEPYRTDVQNTGASPTGLISLGVSGPDAGDFQRHSDTCFTTMVPAQAFCWVQLAFARSTNGPKSARLQVFDPNSGTATVDFSAPP